MQLAGNSLLPPRQPMYIPSLIVAPGDLASATRVMHRAHAIAAGDAYEANVFVGVYPLYEFLN